MMGRGGFSRAVVTGRVVTPPSPLVTAELEDILLLALLLLAWSSLLLLLLVPDPESFLAPPSFCFMLLNMVARAGLTTNAAACCGPDCAGLGPHRAGLIGIACDLWPHCGLGCAWWCAWGRGRVGEYC